MHPRGMKKCGRFLQNRKIDTSIAGENEWRNRKERETIQSKNIPYQRSYYSGYLLEFLQHWSNSVNEGQWERATGFLPRDRISAVRFLLFIKIYIFTRPLTFESFLSANLVLQISAKHTASSLNLELINFSNRCIIFTLVWLARPWNAYSVSFRMIVFFCGWMNGIMIMADRWSRVIMNDAKMPGVCLGPFCICAPFASKNVIRFFICGNNFFNWV